MAGERVASMVVGLPRSEDVSEILPGSLPIHVTIVPEFEHDRALTTVIRDAFDEIAARYAPFHLTGDQEKLFGTPEQIARAEIRVRALAGLGHESLRTLHSEMLAHLYDRHADEVRQGATGITIRNAHFAGEQYAPHVSYYRAHEAAATEGIEQGESFMIDRLHFVQGQPGARQWSVVKTYELGQARDDKAAS